MENHKHSIIPFFIPHEGCPHRCVFCDQRIITGASSIIKPEDILPTLRRCIQSGKCTASGASPRWEAAFYGGSFTCMPVSAQEAYLQQAAAARDEGLIVNIRLSTRPDGISVPILELLKGYGVETVELGVQSMDDEVLRLSCRGHTALQSRDALRLLKSYGFKAGVQLMPGLPGADAASDLLSVREVIELRPHIVRIYPTVVIRGTELHKMHLQGQYRPLDLDEAIPLTAGILLLFQEEGIPVIRLGLQDSPALAGLQKGALVAGPHHPALRQLVESYIQRRLAERGLQKIGARGGSAFFGISPHNQSNFRGLNRDNIRLLQEGFSLRSIEVGSISGFDDDAMLLNWEGRTWQGRTTDLLSGGLSLRFAQGDL